MEQIFDQIEQGELKNMSLMQFLNREDVEADILGATVEKNTEERPRLRRSTGSAKSPDGQKNFARECRSWHMPI